MKKMWVVCNSELWVTVGRVQLRAVCSCVPVQLRATCSRGPCGDVMQGASKWTLLRQRHKHEAFFTQI